MTTFAEMQALVIEQTKRPELTGVTDSAIRLATLRAHHVDFFSRDQTSQLLTWTPASADLFTDFATIYSTVTRLRTPDFLQAEDVVSPYYPTENLEYVTSFKEFWNEFNEVRTSVFTLIGETLRVKFAVATGRARLFYFRNPDTASATYSSWIADNHPDELAKWAAGIVWARSGFAEQARMVQQDIVDFKSLLVTSYLSSKK